MLTYLLLNIFTLSVPFAYSFEKDIFFVGKWRFLFPAIFITAAFFIFWDVIFTRMGVWSFNPDYLVGVYFGGLPLEEWLFFFTIPYACVFIYESLNHFIKKDILKPFATQITFFLIAVLFIIAILNLQKLYTAINFSLSGLLLLIHYVIFKDKILGRFYVAYLVHLIPFFIVNGFLTALPVVQYNNSENLGLRLGTIPIEDTIYSMFLLLMNITIYEYLKNKSYSKHST